MHLTHRARIAETLQFLNAVWGDEECYVDLPAKSRGHWMPHNLLWPDLEAARARIESALENRWDLYFSVATFERLGRRHEDTLPVGWLWADLDTVDPEVLAVQGLIPTIAWKSSDARYQALWRLSSDITARQAEQLNKRLTYKIGADKSGWDLTQVLRVPGTRNYKYSEAGHDVRLLWIGEEIYKASELRERVKDVEVVDEWAYDGEGAVRERAPLGGRAKSLLRTPPELVVLGERSDRLWELECLLAEAGRSELEIFRLVWPCAWNKFKEDGDRGRDRLRRDIRRALGKVAGEAARVVEETEEREGGREGGREGEEREVTVGDASEVGADEETAPRRGSLFIPYGEFIVSRFPEPRWLVQDIWTARAHGLIAGEPKTGKSMLATNLALAVASGEPFLGKFRVDTPGPVLIIQEENDPWVVQDRMWRMASSMGLCGSVVGEGNGKSGREDEFEMPRELPIGLLNNHGWELDDEENREMLELEVRARRPMLVILDPLYLMIGERDTDKSRDVVQFLKWLLRLRYKYGCAVVIIHHYRKQKQEAPGTTIRPGQRIMGSGTFHGWVESAMYCEAMELSDDEMDEGVMRLKLEREFRNVGPQRPLEVILRMDEGDPDHFEAEAYKFNAAGLLERLVREVKEITAAAAAKELGQGWNTQKVKRAASQCESIEVYSTNKAGKPSYELTWVGGRNGG